MDAFGDGGQIFVEITAKDAVMWKWWNHGEHEISDLQMSPWLRVFSQNCW